MIRACPLSVLPPGEAPRVDAKPPIAVFNTEEREVFAIDDSCTGSVEDRNVLAVYQGGEEPVAFLAMNQARLFGRWRRQLNAAPVLA